MLSASWRGEEAMRDYEIISISLEDAVTLVFRREQSGVLLPQ